MTRMCIDLAGRIVIVAGAGGGGIGTSVMRHLAEAGATVVAVNRSPDTLLDHVGRLVDDGYSIVPVIADISSDSGVRTVLKKARSLTGQLYGLVNVAGGAAPETWMPATRVSRETWRTLFTANLESMFFMSQAVAAELRAQGQGGSIVSISSISGMNTAPFHIAYGTAKAAIVAATRTLALELASDNIRVNAVAPGITATDASTTYVDNNPKRDQHAIAMGRRGRPDEQAGPILFLLSDLSTYITGQTLLVDGGLDLKWTHVGADNTSIFLGDDAFRASIIR